MITSGFPILATRDISGSLGFYRDLLGGSVTYQFPAEGEPGYVALQLGSSHLGIGLNAEIEHAEGPRSVSLWFYADDCDATVETLRAGGVTVVEEPADQPWGERMARVLDPDGNEVVLATG